MANNVAVFGEMLADIFPQQTVLGGAPFNVARHLKALGVNPLMLSKVGNDALGEQMLNAMQTLHMPTSGVQIDTAYPTGKVMVHLEHNSHRFEILPQQAYDHINASSALQALTQQAPSLMYFGSLALRETTSCATANTLLSQVQCPRFLDINLRAPWFSKDSLTFAMQHADYLKVNDEELTLLAEMFGLAELEAAPIAHQLKHQFALKQVIVTCGAHGAWMIIEDGNKLSAAPQPLKHALIDTVGAGDAFSAVMILGLLNGWDAQTSLHRANTMASAMCTIRGAAPTSHAFYAEFIKDWQLALA